jgi:hypothetical protein
LRQEEVIVQPVENWKAAGIAYEAICTRSFRAELVCFEILADAA